MTKSERKRLATLREARDNARLAAEIALHKSQLRLSESLNSGGFGDPINPASQFFDGLTPIFPLVPNRFDRRVGTNGIWVSESQLDLIRLYARYTFDTNPIARGIIRGKRNYVFGTGFAYTVEGKPGQRVAKAVVEEAQSILDDFLEANEWDLREPERYVRAQRDGESILRLFPSDDEDCCAKVRTVEPEQMRAPNPAPEWLLGVHTDPDDREQILGYGVTYDGTTENVEDVPPAEISHLKINADLVVTRGITSLFATNDLLTGVQKLLRATVEGESVRQAIAYIVENQLADAGTVQGLAALNTDWNTQIQTPNGTRSVPTERIVPGSVHEMPAARQVKPPPISDTTNATGALAAAYQALAVFFQVPQWMASGDTGNTNFAASLTAESPFVKDTLAEQQFHANANIKLFKKALQMAEDQGRLPEGSVKKLTIYAECPSPAVRDASKETDQNQVLNAAGVLSKKTWTEREELDFDQERANIAEEPPPMPVVAGATPTPPATTPAAQYAAQTGGSK